ncbi:MAG: phytanoyl-CoA dioxygenase family protein [Myxococcota bacterium]
MESAVDPAVAADQLRDSGYTVLPGLYTPDRVQAIRDALERAYRALGSPPLFHPGRMSPGDDLEISSTGFVFHKLLKFVPELAPTLLEPVVVQVLRAVLGGDMHLELVGAVLCDHTRPFFQWHTHVGGIDDERYRRAGLRPTFEQPQRVTMVLYLNDLVEGAGQLLVYPRAITDPMAPPFAVDQTHWEGQVLVDCPQGSVVLVEQCTWHAALPRTRPGLRIYLGGYFAAASAPATFDVDESLMDLREPGALMASVLPGRTRRSSEEP